MIYDIRMKKKVSLIKLIFYFLDCIYHTQWLCHAQVYKNIR